VTASTLRRWLFLAAVALHLATVVLLFAGLPYAAVPLAMATGRCWEIAASLPCTDPEENSI
jgi:hypothetical protein